MRLHRGADCHPVCRFLRSLWFASTTRLQQRHERALPSGYAHTCRVMPNRKTDQKDSDQVANLLRYEWLRIHLLIFCS